MTFISWNINGWTAAKSKVRQCVIENIKPDVAVIIETHLAGDSKVECEGYVPFMHNRVKRHVNAKRNYGGLAILIREEITRFYDITDIDKSIDGLYIIKLINRFTRYTILLIACYLPPERSPWGRDASNFYAHIVNYLYIHSNSCDAVYMCGDVNGRLGNKQDYIKGIDNISDRQVLDKTTNNHGDSLLEFLMDTKMCIVNGRITPENNDYTFISTRGKSVVDYFIVPTDMLNKCIKFEVSRSRELINKYCNVADVDLNLQGCIPDHSLLMLKIQVGCNAEQSLPESVLYNNSIYVDHVSDNDNGSLNDYYKRYKIETVPNDFLSSDEGRQELLHLIEYIENVRSCQNEIDDVYKLFCDTYHAEMNRFFRSRNVHPRAKKRLKKCIKPFWSDHLQQLWNDLCEREKVFLAAEGTVRMRERNRFKDTQKLFDREYRKAERRYLRERQEDIEHICTNDPKKFWQTLKSLGPNKKADIPLEVYDDEGNICRNLNDVLKKWKSDFEKLYSQVPGDTEFDDVFYRQLRDDTGFVNNVPTKDGLNHDISASEVKKSVSQAKNNKSVGLDNLPNEILKNDTSINILTLLFNKIFDYQIIPSVWKVGIIKPIPKSSLVDPRMPLQYRGISLISTVYKVFSNVMNTRIVKVAEENHIFCDEQNGFRKGRSCLDHIFVLTSIIRNRKAQRLPTFVAYIDFEKAFDRVDRNLLYYKLTSLGISGKILNCIKNIYDGSKSGVNVNGYITDWFSSDYGVRQGDCLSPTLFGLFINDLVDDIRSCSKGIQIPNLNLHCLLYADDLALISESEEDLQCMLNGLMNWCKKWRMKINVNKSKVVHYRTKGSAATDVKFKLDNCEVEVVKQYKYLGMILDSSLDFLSTAKVLADSAGRALGAVMSKFKSNKGLGFNTYTKMFHTGVCPILDYCSGVWGFSKYECIDTVQNRAIRFYLGVHKFAPNLAINGDMGWYMSAVRRKVEMMRFWNRVHKVNHDRILKKVFLWDKLMCKRNWSFEIKQVFNDINMINAFHNDDMVDIEVVQKCLHENMCHKWSQDILNVPKLRTYVKFKQQYNTETYVKEIHNRKQRSTLAQLRCGILPLSIETGRYTDIPLEYRLCLFCDQDVIESESHFLLYCNKYAMFRYELLRKARLYDIMFDFRNEDDKLTILMSDALIKDTARFINTAFDMRQKCVYVNV